jgi:hypothetical protein
MEAGTTTRLTVATINANCNGVSHQGAIIRDGNVFIVALDGRPVAQAGSLDSAAHRLAGFLHKALPRQRDEDWGVAVHCLMRPDVALVFGNRGGGGGGGGIPNPCVGRIIAEYGRGENELERALEFAARLLARCCGSS